jgi:hypothetical protein
VTSLRARLRDDRGSPSVELLGALPLILLFALAAWQLLLVGHAVTAAENAARAGSRTAAVHGVATGTHAAYEAVSPWLQAGTSVEAAPPAAVTVRINVPIVVPQLRSERFTVSRSAVFPPG